MYLECNSGFTMKYDVVIVGAGPSGSTSAKCLAEKGVKVLLIDKEKFPRDKPCGGGLPTKVLNRFPYVLDLIDSISYGSITYSASLKYRLKIQRDKPLIATILRKNFDNGLVKIAVAKGVDFLDEKTVTDIKILKGIGGGCDEEACRIIGGAPNWNPGKQRGKSVRVKMVIPILFRLEGI